jgi:tellurium resistance protein TerD
MVEKFDHEEDIDEEELEYLPDVAKLDEPENRITRGQEINLTEKDPTMKEIQIGVGWDLKAFESHPLDLDASLFLLDKNDETREDSDFVFYNNLTAADGAVKHMGDSRTGAGEGDDEVIMINLDALPFDVVRIQFVLSIYNMDYLDHDFSMVKNVYFRIVNSRIETEIFRYELDEELTEHEGLIIGELDRIGAEWIFRAVGETVKGGLGKIAQDHAIMVAHIVQE